MVDSYARFLEIVASTEDEATAAVAVEKLVLHLRSSGRVGLLPKLLRELQRTAARRTALAPIVEVAHAKDGAEALGEAAKMGIVAKHAQVNHDLITGWRAQSGGTLVDRSGKQALIDIYQRVTA